MFYSNEIKKRFRRALTTDFFQKAINSRDHSIGLILMFHRVDNIDQNRFGCNEAMKVSPGFLESLIVQLKRKGFSFVSMDKLHEILGSEEGIKKVVAFTFDDGYRDNLTNGLPILKKHSVPFTIYVSTAMTEQKFIYWWYLLEDFISQHNSFSLSDGDKYVCKSKKEKERVFMIIREKLINVHPSKLGETLLQLFGEHSFDLYKYNDSLPLTWDHVRQLSKEPLVTIGSHTHSHMRASLFSREDFFADVNRAQELLSRKAGIIPKHFCYPYGGISSEESAWALAQAGFKTAVTSSPGNIYKRHISNPFLLPRFFVIDEQKPTFLSDMIWLRYWGK